MRCLEEDVPHLRRVNNYGITIQIQKPYLYGDDLIVYDEKAIRMLHTSAKYPSQWNTFQSSNHSAHRIKYFFDKNENNKPSIL